MSKGYAMIAEGLKMMAAGYEMLAGTESAECAASVAATPEKAEKTVPEESTKEEAEQKEPIMPITEVRALVRQKIKDGKMEQCQELLKSVCGCERLSDIPEEKRAEFYRKVEVL